MEETIFINIGGFHQTGTHHMSTLKTRLWPSLIATTRWIYKNPIPGNTSIHSGIGLTTINNLAIAVEGFITDIIIEYHDTDEIEKSPILKKIEKGEGTWKPKKEVFNEVFENGLASCAAYESIEMLFLLRNNFAHGRTHAEIQKTETATGQRFTIESTDKNYQTVRNFFYEKGLMQQTETSSNVEVLWKMSISLFFLAEVRNFMFSVLDKNKSEKFASIIAELNYCFQI